MNIYKNNKEYKVGLYFRLSKEDGDKVESESITNQRSILNRFCKENELTVYKEYIDDGISGLKFDRPGFNDMKLDIENGNINMVIVKDLSRLGRDYSEVGKYIERFFPENNIRFIAIYDQIDTITETDDMLPLRAVMNDLYCKDTSRKIRAMLYSKKKDGVYISVSAPYGYKKDPNKKGHLVIDEEESKIVKDIFNMYLNGMGTYQISKKLNSDNVPPPASNRKNITTVTNKWHTETIRRILKKEVYVGDTVLGKTKKINYKSNKRINLPTNDWLVTKNTHEAIISKEDFKIVNKMLKNNKGTAIKKYDYLLRGIVKCKECGCSITWLTAKDKYKDKVYIRRYGVCPTAEKDISVRKCTKKYINYDTIEKLIIDEVKKVISVYIDKVDYKKVQKKYNEILNQKVREYRDRIEKVEKDIEDINSKLDKAYIDKLNNVISTGDYERISNIFVKKRDELYKILEDVKKEYNGLNVDCEKNFIEEKELKKKIEDILKSGSITKKELMLLVDKIYIDKDKNIDIIFNFKELSLINGFV